MLHNARTIRTDQVQNHASLSSVVFKIVAFGKHNTSRRSANCVTRSEARYFFIVDVHSNSRELPSKPRHAAFNPTSAMFGDKLAAD
ncbi:MAG: hypothetical protein R3A47_01635 [Polyangiales bacterium]